ncbi:MAG: alkyl sulfatase dimerization domain-containing protein [Ilumatobacteraceae bacterium]
MNPLELSTTVIDSGVVDQPINRVTNELSELAPDLAIVESFSHSVAWDSGDGVVCFDASGVGSGNAVIQSIRGWRSHPISTLVYTHGHADHIGGSGAFAADANDRGHGRLHVIGHEKVRDRIDRYTATSDWNLIINQRQFGGISSDMGLHIGSKAQSFLPLNTLRPDEVFQTTHTFMAGDTHVELHHARGETDDHLWAWFPEKKWIFSGDFVIWNFPNAGNPQKVQRYALEWAQALRRMIAQGPELLVPAHGLPIEGKARIAGVLDDIASALETLVAQVIEMMNAGATLDAIIHTVKVPQRVLDKPYLRPFYDEPEFVVRNIWRLYGGWWDGAASRLKPAPDAQIAAELAHLAGGAEVLMRRALELMTTGEIRLACHLADLAGWAAPGDAAIHADRAIVYNKRRDLEMSLMSKGIYKAAARESEAVANCNTK